MTDIQLALNELSDEYNFVNQNEYAKLSVRSLRVSISALEKQIPKTPVRGRDEEGREGWFCPACKALEVLAGDEEYLNNYCRICGQKMEWEVPDE